MIYFSEAVFLTRSQDLAQHWEGWIKMDSSKKKLAAHYRANPEICV
jgi:hypothetical protein